MNGFRACGICALVGASVLLAYSGCYQISGTEAEDTGSETDIQTDSDTLSDSDSDTSSDQPPDEVVDWNFIVLGNEKWEDFGADGYCRSFIANALDDIVACYRGDGGIGFVYEYDGHESVVLETPNEQRCSHVFSTVDQQTWIVFNHSIFYRAQSGWEEQSVEDGDIGEFELIWGSTEENMRLIGTGEATSGPNGMDYPRYSWRYEKGTWKRTDELVPPVTLLHEVEYAIGGSPAVFGGYDGIFAADSDVADLGGPFSHGMLIWMGGESIDDMVALSHYGLYQYQNISGWTPWDLETQDPDLLSQWYGGVIRSSNELFLVGFEYLGNDFYTWVIHSVSGNAVESMIPPCIESKCMATRAKITDDILFVAATDSEQQAVILWKSII